MSASTVIKQFSLAATGVACISVAASFANAPTANAAIFAVGDSGSWTSGGANTLSNLGYKMLNVPNNPSVAGGFTAVKQLASPAGTLTFSNPVLKAYVGTDWSKLATSRLTAGSPVYYNSTKSVNISLTGAILALDLFVETNSIAPILFNIAITAFGGTTQTVQTQAVAGNIGGQYFGFYATDGDTISSVSIVSPKGAQGFAMGDIRVASERVPEPTTILGTLAFGSFLARTRLKRKQQQKFRGNSLT